MKKLLLTSDGFSNPKIGQEFLALLGKNPADVKVLFVTTASRVEEEKFYVRESEKELIGFGILKENISWVESLENVEPESYDAMYVCGGNTFYLMHEIRRTEFDMKISNFINSGKVYVGVSAGSYIACPTIEMAHWKHTDNNKVGLKDLTGLNFVPFLMSVHYKLEYAEILNKEITLSKYPVKILKDGQAVGVLGDVSKIID